MTCLLNAANRDPARYRDAERFGIFRDDLSATNTVSAVADHLAFAVGRLFRAGAPPARAEVETAVHHLLDALPGLRLDDGLRPVES